MNLTLSLSEITKRYHGRTVLDACSFKFGTGFIHVLMGPNGSGKSTLLRICALLEKPDSGAVSYYENGTELGHDLGLRRRITLMLPSVGVFNATVFQNISYGLRVRGMRQSEIRDRTIYCLKLVGLQGKQSQNALTLSTGETRRLGIARALAIDPEILFLDEPTASVDQENSELIRAIILKMRAAGRPMVLMSTHDDGEARILADSMLFIRDRVLVRSGG